MMIAHRGASGVAAENSLAALHAAADQGADRAELDLRLTADGVPIVMHDAKINRTSDGAGYVGQLTWHNLRSLKLRPRGGEDPKLLCIPTLAQALETAAALRLPLCLEFKSRGHQPELVRKTVELLTEAGLLADTWLWSFDPHDLAAVRQLSPRPQRGLVSLRWPGEAGRAQADMLVLLAAQLLVRGRPEQLKDWPLYAWTVNRAWPAVRLVQRGAAGLITNHPARIRAALRGGLGDS